MNIEQIRSFRDRRPIRPLVIRTSTGENYSVRGPEHLAFAGEGDDGVVLLLQDRGGMALLDFSIITEITQDSTDRESDPGAWAEWI